MAENIAKGGALPPVKCTSTTTQSILERPHGLFGILQMLLSVPGYIINNPRAEADIKGSVDYLLSIQTPEGNFPVLWMRLEEDDLWKMIWCIGATGPPEPFILLARAYWFGKRRSI